MKELIFCSTVLVATMKFSAISANDDGLKMLMQKEWNAGRWLLSNAGQPLPLQFELVWM